MIKSLLTVSLLALFFMGCGGSNPTPNNTTVTEKSQQTLEGTTWKLVSFGLTRMAVPKDASIAFSAGRYSGHGGCNGVGGDYTLTGDKLHLSAGFSTMMACPELDLEHKYMKYLQSVTAYKIEGNTLDLLSNGQILLRFQAEPTKKKQ